MELLELIDNLESGSGSASSFLSVREDGVRVRGRKSDPRKLLEAARFINDIGNGKYPMRVLQEAMSTSDFPILFADVLDRQMLGFYKATQPTWEKYCRKGTVPDFRNVKRFAVDGAEAVLGKVPELTEYPERALEESKDEYSVFKYGSRIDLSWEAMINDDLDAFRRTPERLALAARRTEQKFATELFVGKKGPNETLYTSGRKNLLQGGPTLSLESLQKALTVLSEARDNDGEPILVDMVYLVVPPALQVVAENILHATQLNISGAAAGAAANSELWTQNWMRSRFELVVEPYLPVVASEENANTQWYLIASPSIGRPVAEVGFLRGYEQPSLYERAPTARRVGGGGEVNESFTDDSLAWRIRHVIGGTRLENTGGWKATVASTGKGS
jgi:hypothetical protein